ncbi:hypothetical protein [Paraburkholderia sp. J12]|uniref:hypothetical protein n=1 Tax=Paraburkholderia sp. J12 TaxID=2805432 RepID=UPI002ABE3B7D|nr:hypothetical protein [Paraburkholderia sp. J12]
MSASQPKTPTPPQQDPLDEALEETFPASDPIAIEPEPSKHKHGDDDGKKKHHDSGHHGGKH